MLSRAKQLILSLFKWSEKYLRTDVKYLAKGGFWLSVGQAAAMLAGFFLSLAFAHMFSKESFGVYKFIISIAGILGVFSLTQIGTAITRAVANGFDGSLRHSFKTNLKWSLGILIGGLSLGVYYFINGNNVLAYSFALAGIALPITASASLYSAYIFGKKDFKQSTIYSIIRNTIPALCLIITIFLTENLIILMTVYFVSAALVSLFLYYSTLKKYPGGNNKVDPELGSYSRHLSLMEIIGQIAGQVDKILIFHYLGAAPLAIYAFAIAPVEQLQSGKKILSALVLPKMSERPLEILQKSAPRKALWLTAYALALAGIYSLIAPHFYRFFYPQYLDSVFYSQIYSLTLLAVSGTVFEEILIAHKRTKELYAHRTIVPVLKIVLFFVLLPTYGLMGLVITHVIMRPFSGLLGYYFVKYPFKR